MMPSSSDRAHFAQAATQTWQDGHPPAARHVRQVRPPEQAPPSPQAGAPSAASAAAFQIEPQPSGRSHVPASVQAGAQYASRVPGGETATEPSGQLSVEVLQAAAHSTDRSAERRIALDTTVTR